MSNHNRLLLVDDDRELCALLSEYLSHEGYLVSCAHDADQALTALAGQSFDLLVLDIMMPGRSGLELLQELRPAVQTPVIMLTGRGDDIDRILGLEMGADDYLGKPCNPRELLARIRAVLRRSRATESTESSVVPCLNGIELDTGRREARLDGELLELTSAEFNVLMLLMRQAGTVVGKAELTEKVLHRKLTAYDRAIDVHVSRLRQKLAGHRPQETFIKTVRGEGYLMVSEH
ncbi:response regulator [Marinobacterium arenosum]|uniref:response regulator n=1 Tax=Marinobacterium arenosum TaxID=2862496 RepID=UPI001C96B7A9|nr:response regulator [Marinobacterium arenosum]MBY4678623.1 response regulator [Marinobacterium arenosum]